MYENYFGFIYETTNLLNNKKYIGKCIFSRKNDWKSYHGSGLYLKRAIKKLGRENFRREILFLAVDELELNELEEAVILISDAVKDLKIGRATLLNRLKNVSFPEYKYL